MTLRTLKGHMPLRPQPSTRRHTSCTCHFCGKSDLEDWREFGEEEEEGEEEAEAPLRVVPCFRCPRVFCHSCIEALVVPPAASYDERFEVSEAATP